jgi:hypothetical protein
VSECLRTGVMWHKPSVLGGTWLSLSEQSSGWVGGGAHCDVGAVLQAAVPEPQQQNTLFYISPGAQWPSDAA